jgi:MYXO-CTERM domain-containing protein
MRKTILAAAAASFLLTVPAAASAQGTGDAGTVDTSYGNPQQEDDDGFPWGLLGLLGLAGLIPRKRHDHRVDVDTRR